MRSGKLSIMISSWWPEQRDGNKAFPSKAESELAKNVTPVRIASIFHSARESRRRMSDLQERDHESEQT